MATIQTMHLKPSQVAGRRKDLEDICINLERYVQGIPRGTVRWQDIVVLAVHMLVVNHKGERQYVVAQNQPWGSVGHLLTTGEPIDKLVYPAWIIQVGAATAHENYNSFNLRHRNLDPTLIATISSAEQAGHNAINKHKEQQQLPAQQQDAEFMAFFENRRLGVHRAVVRAMDKDPMFVLDPYEVSSFVFRVRVAVFYNPPSFVPGLDIKGQHIMDRHLLIERLGSLQNMADKHESWIAKHIEAAKASVLRIETYDDMYVLGLLLDRGPDFMPTAAWIVLISVAMWMHTPRDTQPAAFTVTQTQAYGELVRLLAAERQSKPDIDNMWKGQSVYRPLPLLPAAALHEDDVVSKGLIGLCNTANGLAAQRRRQSDEAKACRQQMADAKVKQLEAETKERRRQEAEEAERRTARENQQAVLDEQRLGESQKVMADIVDEINEDGKLGDDSRWFWRMMEALANPDKPFDARVLDYLDSPDMLDGLSFHFLSRIERYVQRRKYFGSILSDLLEGRITTAEGLGPLADCFQRARIAVDNRRGDISCSRAGRGLLMLRMMVASLESTSSAALLTTPAAAAPSSDLPLVVYSSSYLASPAATDTAATTALDSASVPDTAATTLVSSESEGGSVVSGNDDESPTGAASWYDRRGRGGRRGRNRNHWAARHEW